MSRALSGGNGSFTFKRQEIILTEKVLKYHHSPEREEKEKLICRYAAVALAALLLVYYCFHPALYAGSSQLTLLESRRTYAVAGISVLLIALCLTPNKLSDQINRQLSWVWFCIAPFAVYFSLLYLNAEKFNIEFWSLNRVALVFTFVFLFLVQSMLFCLTGSLRFSVVIYAVLIAVLGIANCFVISFRGMALSAADLFSVETAMTVASEYTYEFDWYMFMEVLLTFGICTVSLKLRRERLMHPAGRVALLALCGMLSYGYYFICCRTDFLEEHDIRSQGFTHQLRYKEYDMLFTTLCTCFYLAADKPEGYSVEAVEQIAENYESDMASAISPALNLIVIMNESFADYQNIGTGLNLSEDAMPFIHSLTENTIKGNAYASIFGGNTPNSEYEFLTGNTMAFLPASSVGFHLFVRGKMPSVASQLKALGYDTLAIHPYRGNNYRRHIVYPQIGFDAYYTRDDFENPDYIRNYISDASLSERIIEEWENSRGAENPFFCYSVTVQNHGGYAMSNAANIDFQIEVLDEDVDHTKTEIYINLIKETDGVFQSLVEYFEKQEEPMAILMFGDHQANLGDSTYEHLIGTESECSSEELMEKYKVPFILWANYDIQEEIIEKTSLNYLYSIMAERLNLPMTGYQNYLLDLSEEIPVINTLGYWGADGVFYELDDQDSPYWERINEYHILEYNYIFGREDRNLELFSLKEQ